MASERGERRQRQKTIAETFAEQTEGLIELYFPMDARSLVLRKDGQSLSPPQRPGDAANNSPAISIPVEPSQN